MIDLQYDLKGTMDMSEDKGGRRRDRYSDDFALTKYTLPVVWQMAEVIPGGFLIYKEDEKRELIYSNKKVHEIFGCKDLAEFKELTGYTFNGMVYSEDFEKVQDAIDSQIDSEEGDGMDHVVYRIKRKDGQIRWVDDYGHFSHSPEYGDVYYVFINDITETKAGEDAEKTLESLPAKIGQILEKAAAGDYESVNRSLEGLKESLS